MSLPAISVVTGGSAIHIVHWGTDGQASSDSRGPVTTGYVVLAHTWTCSDATVRLDHGDDGRWVTGVAPAGSQSLHILKTTTTYKE